VATKRAPARTVAVARSKNRREADTCTYAGHFAAFTDRELGAALRAFLSEPNLVQYSHVRLEEIFDELAKCAERFVALRQQGASLRKATIGVHVLVCHETCDCQATDACDATCDELKDDKGPTEHCKHCDGTYGCNHTDREIEWLLGLRNGVELPFHIRPRRGRG
jgi:hypothetical protein